MRRELWSGYFEFCSRIGVGDLAGLEIWFPFISA